MQLEMIEGTLPDFELECAMCKTRYSLGGKVYLTQNIF